MVSIGSGTDTPGGPVTLGTEGDDAPVGDGPGQPTRDPQVRELAGAMQAADMEPPENRPRTTETAEDQLDTTVGRRVPLKMSATTAQVRTRILYRRASGRAETVLADWYDSLLQMKDRETGLSTFSAEPVYVEDTRTRYLCRLHPDHPDREMADRLNLPTCMKSNLVNQHAVNEHLRRQHFTSFLAIHDEEDRLHREQLLESQSALLEVQRKNADVAQLTQTDALEARERSDKLLELLTEVVSKLTTPAVPEGKVEGHTHAYNRQGLCKICGEKKPRTARGLKPILTEETADAANADEPGGSATGDGE